jgi:hypothetical protein
MRLVEDELIIPYRAHVGRYDRTRSHVKHRGNLCPVGIGLVERCDNSYSPANYPLKKARVSRVLKNSVTENTTYGTLRPQACFRYHREEEQDQQVTSKRLQEMLH